MIGEGSAKVAWGLALWALWTFATWWFEGRIETFRRPDAVADRLVYAVVVNVLIGVLGAILVLRHLLPRGGPGRRAAGFGEWRRTLIWAPVGFALGLALYLGQGAPTTDPVVIVNAYAQVLAVSVAEILVCWSVVGGLVRLAIGGPARASAPVAMVVAAVLFGLYHVAHSPPFNTPGPVAFLSAVGLITGLFFVLSQDVYATVVFHTFLGTYGVTQALAAGDRLASFETPQAPLILTALGALLVLVAADAVLLRGRA